jgi:hypothetical protein
MERVLLFVFGVLAAAGLLASAVNGLVDTFKSRKLDDIEGAHYSSLRGYLQRDSGEEPAKDAAGGSAVPIGLERFSG